MISCELGNTSQNCINRVKTVVRLGLGEEGDWKGEARRAKYRVRRGGKHLQANS